MGTHRVVVVGGGFGGLSVTRALAGADVDVALVDRTNHHLFQPLLYQVAAGILPEGLIAPAIRSVLTKQENARAVLAEVHDLDLDRKVVVASAPDGRTVELPYDTLVVAAGAHFAYFGHDDWAYNAPGLKSLDDALEIRRRILIAFEAAEREHDPERRQEWMTFVVVGGGPTGVELAGALGEIANDTLKRDFRSIDPSQARIVLVEAMDRILPPYPPDRSSSAKRQLERLGVDVRTGTRVVHIDDFCVKVAIGDREERWPARTVLWAAGVEVASFVTAVAKATGAEQYRAGRIIVGPDLTIAGHPEIFVVGDAAVQPWKPDRPTPGVAQGAIQGGSYASWVIRRRLSGQTTQPFRYSNHGDVAIIGRLSGVTDIPWLGPFGRQGGFFAWALWLLIHIAFLIGYANRVVVVTRWGWSFFTHGRGSRLITGDPLLPPIEEPEPPA